MPPESPLSAEPDEPPRPRGSAAPWDASLRKLERFLTIVHAGSLSRAAERLGVSQPALSRELRELEDDLGVALFYRQARGLAPTPAGEVLREQAEAMLSQAANLRNAVRSTQDELSGRVAFGMPPSLSGMVTLPVIEQLRRRFPKVMLHLREAMSRPLHTALVERDIDVAVLTAPVNDAQLLLRPLASEPMMLVAPAGLAIPPAPVPLEFVAQCPLIAPAFPNNARLLVETALQGIGRHATIALETDSAPIGELVARGLGYAVLPSCAAGNPGMVASGAVTAPIERLEITWVLACPVGMVVSGAAAHLYRAIYSTAREAIAEGRWNARYLGP